MQQRARCSAARWGARIVALAAGLVLATASGCATMPRAGGGEGPPAVPNEPIYRIWHEGGVWHVRAAPAGGTHRFQGSVQGLTGGLLDPIVNESLRDRVARSGNEINFDFDAVGREVGFDAPATGGCLRFDLWLDGTRRPDLVRFGPQGTRPTHLPTVSCP